MGTTRDVLHSLIDHLPESEFAAAERFLQFLSQEPVGPEFAERLRRSIAQTDASELIVCESNDDMVTKLLDGK